MAEQISKETPEKNVIRSLVSFDPNEGEELFLLFSTGRQNGPGIERDGRGSPWMSHPNPKWAHLHITDPDIQRWGTWFLDDSTKQADCVKLENKINELQLDPKTDPELIDQLKDLQCKNKSESVYIDEFKDCYQNYEIVAIQGIGDLTMNHWNVGYLCSPFTKDEPEILHLLNEPIHERVYSCLVKWRDRKPKYEIKNVRFNRYVFNTNKKDPMVVQIDGEGVADQIEFAVYGQQMIKPNPQKDPFGEIFEISEIVHQFPDVRHLFQLANLNPNDKGRPRYYFGKEQVDDIWFGEAELLDNRNLRRAALAGSIELNRLYQGLGASKEQVRKSLTSLTSCYTERNGLGLEPLRYDQISTHLDAKGDSSIAEWRIVTEDDSLIEIRLRENRYPCTMIGLNDKGQFYFYAWKGKYGQWPGLTLRQAARQLLINGASSAILCDEGGDVFQYLDNGNGLVPVIEPGRGQVRALFVVGRRK